MSAAGVAEIVAFGLSACIAIAGGLGMATTMSMFRSGIFLMASFLGVAALFILLSADLLGLLQIMMYIGGMLVMILFMVLFMHDPGGAMMAGMSGMMTPVERFFSLGLTPRQEAGERHQDDAHGAHVQDKQQEEHEHQHHGHQHSGPGANEADTESGHGNHGQMGGMSMGGMSMGGMDMSDMSMVTPVRGWAAWIALATGFVLVALLLLRPVWRISAALPDPRSPEQVGSLLMGRYMIGFEGAGFLILIGIVGATLMAHTRRHPDRADRAARVAIEGGLPGIEDDALPPFAPPLDDAGEVMPEPRSSHGEHENPGHGHPS